MNSLRIFAKEFQEGVSRQFTSTIIHHYVIVIHHYVIVIHHYVIVIHHFVIVIHHYVIVNVEYGFNFFLNFKNLPTKYLNILIHIL